MIVWQDLDLDSFARKFELDERQYELLRSEVPANWRKKSKNTEAAYPCIAPAVLAKPNCYLVNQFDYASLQFEEDDTLNESELAESCPSLLRSNSKLFKEFFDLDAHDPNSFTQFASKFGMLSQRINPKELERLTGSMLPSDFFKIEPLPYWKWHVSRFQFTVRLYDALQLLPEAKAMRAIRDLYEEARNTLPVGPITEFQRFSVAQILEGATPSISFEPLFSPTHIEFDESSSHVPENIHACRDHLNGLLEEIFVDHSAMTVDYRTGIIDVTPTTTLGAIYWTFFRSIRRKVSKPKQCQGCGTMFRPSRPNQMYCKDGGTTDRCSKRAQRARATKELR